MRSWAPSSSTFALPLKERHKVFLCRALLPLHKPKGVTTAAARES
jgi:hypothetical protein